MIVLGNEINFNKIEKEIYEYGCQVARELMKQVMNNLDNYLAKERDRKIYRNKGKRNYQLDPFDKSKAIIRNVRDKEARTTILKFLKENKYEEILMYLKALEMDAEDEKTKKKLRDLHHYFTENQEGLMPYLLRGLALPDLEEGLIYRTMGTMEHSNFDAICQRMKHRKGSWSIAGGGNMAKILARKTSGRLKKVLNRLVAICISPKLTKVIQGTLSVAQIPQRVGKGYSYATKGSLPYEEVALTNGRNVIRKLLAVRSL